MKTLDTRADDLSLLTMIKFSCYYLVAAGLQHLKTSAVLVQFCSSFCSFVKNIDHQN